MKLALTVLTCYLFISLTSCQNYQTEEKDFVSTNADTISVSGFSGDSVKLIKNATIKVKVREVYATTKAISEIAQQLGGLIQHQNIESTQEQVKELKISNDSLLSISTYTTQADITARIPSQHLEQFLFKTSDFGYFISNSRMDVDDKSLQYLATHLKQQNRAQILNPSNHKKELTSIQVLNRKDEVVDQEIAKRQIDADVNFSTVQLSLFQNSLVKKEIIANYAVGDYQLPFHQNLSNAFYAGWSYFLSFVVAITHLWIFLITAIIVWLFMRRFYQVRKFSIPKV